MLMTKRLFYGSLCNGHYNLNLVLLIVMNLWFYLWIYPLTLHKHMKNMETLNFTIILSKLSFLVLQKKLQGGGIPLRGELYPRSALWVPVNNKLYTGTVPVYK